MLGLKEQVFGEVGYSADLQLSMDELNEFRRIINDHWLLNIEMACPELHAEAKKIGIENYHQIADRVNHQKLWHKSSRVLPKASVDSVKSLPFFSILKNEFGDFSISDVYDTEQRHGQEEIYWRLVRPNVQSDVGPLHKDNWFHGAANSGYGMFSKDAITVKAWIPIFCEKGKSGLALLGGSHLREWKYHIEVEDGMVRPKPDEDLSQLGAALVPTDAGNVLLFNDGVLHGGVLNAGRQTRVSAEITLVLDRSAN
jgi:hypothetical protein